ncbi:MAG: hypothetical protein JWN70_2519 [Planctomycetaceae bacterium]|nr:hypothetical protein [Planctomycetaceae bacterium]
MSGQPGRTHRLIWVLSRKALRIVISRETLIPFASLQPPATRKAIDEAADVLNLIFPRTYVELMLASNGLTVTLQEYDVVLYEAEFLVERNETCETQSYLGNVLRIGDDSGGTGFHLNLSTEQVIAVGSGCPSIKDGWLVSESLTDWINSHFAVNYPEPEYREPVFVRVSLVKPLSIKALAELKQCLELPDFILQLKRKCEQLPVVLLRAELESVRGALVDHPEIAAALIAEDIESQIQYPMVSS